MKKILVTVLAMALLCIMAVGGTLSYFTDTDADVNVMAVGNVKIEQHEQKRDENNDLVDFVDTAFYPYTGAYVEDEPTTGAANIDGVEYQLLSTANNAVDKIVTVENIGSEDAYIRTVFAFEAELIRADGVVTGATSLVKGNVGGIFADPSAFTLYTGTNEIIIYKHIGESGAEEFNTTPEGADAAYIIGMYIYAEKLLAPEGENSSISAPSLLQIYLDSSVGNDFYDAVGDEYEILVLSQAVQAQGFEDQGAELALNAAFGEITAVNAADWFSSVSGDTETETP